MDTGLESTAVLIAKAIVIFAFVLGIVPIILWAENLGGKCYLLDGRNRLDAMEAIGLGISFDDPLRGLPSKVLYAKELLGKIVDGTTLLAADPYSYVISANIHRRHLSAEDKRRLIGELLNADPSKSNRVPRDMDR